MKKHIPKYVTFIILLLFISSCRETKPERSSAPIEFVGLESTTKSVEQIDNPRRDTIVKDCKVIFEDHNYFVELVIENDVSPYSELDNAAFIFGIRSRNGTHHILTDSIYSSSGEIEFKDFNGDEVQDILIQRISDARNNSTYNLYLSDIKNNSLKRVKEFDAIKNPVYRKDLQLIESYVKSGKDYLEFYKLIPEDSIYRYDILVYNKHDDQFKLDYMNAIDQIKNY